MALRSLRTIAATFLGLIAVATLLTGLGVHLLILRTVDRQVDKRLASEAAEILDTPPRPDLAMIGARIVDEAGRRDSGDIGFTLTDGEGRTRAGNIALRRRLPPGASVVHANDGIAGLTRGRALVVPLADGARLTLIAESEPIDEYDARRLLILSCGFGLILLLFGGGVAVFSVVIGRRIEAVRAAADAIVGGDLRRRVPLSGTGRTFNRQAEAFNRMLDRIEELMATLSSVSNEVAHDLRTPLARLRGQLVAIRDSADSDALRDSLDEAVAQSDAILALFAAILRIAEVEGGDRRARFAALDLGVLAGEAAEAMAPMVEDSGRHLEAGPFPATPIAGDARLLMQLTVNLIENAVHHTPEGTAIRVAVVRDDDAVVLRVADTGPGIAEADRAVALRRFGRLDRSRGMPGHGLGLSLAQAIARLHHGVLVLSDAQPGLCVEVRLPARAEA
ncbi:ATP-binding protein [Sphingomonas sp. CJ20]